MSDQGTQGQISNHGRDATSDTDIFLFDQPFCVVRFKSNIKTSIPLLDCCKGEKRWSQLFCYLHGMKVVPSSTSHFLVITIFIPVIVAIILMVVNSRTLLFGNKIKSRTEKLVDPVTWKSGTVTSVPFCGPVLCAAGNSSPLRRAALNPPTRTYNEGIRNKNE